MPDAVAIANAGRFLLARHSYPYLGPRAEIERLLSTEIPVVQANAGKFGIGIKNGAHPAVCGVDGHHLARRAAVFTGTGQFGTSHHAAVQHVGCAQQGGGTGSAGSPAIERHRFLGPTFPAQNEHRCALPPEGDDTTGTGLSIAEPTAVALRDNKPRGRQRRSVRTFELRFAAVSTDGFWIHRHVGRCGAFDCRLLCGICRRDRAGTQIDGADVQRVGRRGQRARRNLWRDPAVVQPP